MNGGAALGTGRVAPAPQASRRGHWAKLQASFSLPLGFIIVGTDIRWPAAGSESPKFKNALSKLKFYYTSKKHRARPMLFRHIYSLFHRIALSVFLSYIATNNQPCSISGTYFREPCSLVVLRGGFDCSEKSEGLLDATDQSDSKSNLKPVLKPRMTIPDEQTIVRNFVESLKRRLEGHPSSQRDVGKNIIPNHQTAV